MLRKIGEKEILNVAVLIKTWEETHKVTVDDYAVLKLFTKDVPETFKTDACDGMCSLYFDKREIPTYKEYMKLADEYNKVKDDNECNYYYYYIVATMMKVIYTICDY